MFNPEFDLFKDLLALFLEFVGHVLVSSESTQLVIVVQYNLLDVEIVLRDLSVPLDMNLQHILSFILSRLEGGYFPKARLFQSISDSLKDTSEESYLDL